MLSCEILLSLMEHNKPHLQFPQFHCTLEKKLYGFNHVGKAHACQHPIITDKHKKLKVYPYAMIPWKWKYGILDILKNSDSKCHKLVNQGCSSSWKDLAKTAELFLCDFRNSDKEAAEEFEDALDAVLVIPLIFFITDERRSHCHEYQPFLDGNHLEFCPPPGPEQHSRDDTRSKHSCHSSVQHPGTVFSGKRENT